MPQHTQVRKTSSHQRIVVITGGNTGLGYYGAEQLAEQGYRVVIASRNEKKAATAIDNIRSRIPDAQLEFQKLDLASLDSVAQAVTALNKLPHIDGLLLNAGVVGSRKLRQTQDRFELQIGTNHLGHFALVAGLLPKLKHQDSARIVHLGSISHRWVRLPKGQLFSLRYRNFQYYALSKLAVMTFGFELARRLEEQNSRVQSIVAHPGFSWDHFDTDQPEATRRKKLPWYLALLLKPIAQGKRAGARVLSYAIENGSVLNGEYWGPDGFFQLHGEPGLVSAKRHCYDRIAANRLWQQSEKLTGYRIE